MDLEATTTIHFFAQYKNSPICIQHNYPNKFAHLDSGYKVGTCAEVGYTIKNELHGKHEGVTVYTNPDSLMILMICDEILIYLNMLHQKILENCIFHI